MAKAKKAVVIEKKQKAQKAAKIKVVPNKVQKKVPEVKKAVEAKVKKVQPKIVQPKAKKENPKVNKVEPEVPKVEPSLIKPEVIAHWAERGLEKINKELETPLNVSEMTIWEIMLQKGLSYEGAISFLKTNQRK